MCVMQNCELWDITKWIREKQIFCRPRCVWSNLDLCFYPEGICSETGLKYDLATQNEVGMHIKSQIENKTKPGYIL